MVEVLQRTEKAAETMHACGGGAGHQGDGAHAGEPDEMKKALQARNPDKQGNVAIANIGIFRQWPTIKRDII